MAFLECWFPESEAISVNGEMARQAKRCTCPLPDTTLVNHVDHVLKEIPVQLTLIVLVCRHAVLHVWFLDRECEREND